jgi:hypothetical protein
MRFAVLADEPTGGRHGPTEGTIATSFCGSPRGLTGFSWNLAPVEKPGLAGRARMDHGF